jgi:hypothetical protein
MKPPLCKVCGEAHWSRLCHTDRVERDASGNHTVTAGVTVTAPVTPKLIAPSQLAAAQAEIEALQAEVVKLKRALAEVGHKVMTGAERARKHRERKRQ